MGEPDDEDRAPGTALEAYETLRELALSEYPSIVSDAVVERGPGDAPRNLRVLFTDDSFLDVWLSEEKYSYHWQSGETVIRFDNAPHHEHVDTHPHHRHENGAITSSTLVGDPVTDFRTVMDDLERKRIGQ